MITEVCFHMIADNRILGDPGVVSRVDKMSVVKVYCRIEKLSPLNELSMAIDEENYVV